MAKEFTIRALKADGHCYRWWTVPEHVRVGGLVMTHSPQGVHIQGPKGGVIGDRRVVGFYWEDCPWNLWEFYWSDGRLKNLYLNVTSTPLMTEAGLEYIDYDLDVIKHGQEQPKILDEDEFEEARMRLGYSEALVRHVWDIARRGVEFLDRWAVHYRDRFATGCRLPDARDAELLGQSLLRKV